MKILGPDDRPMSLAEIPGVLRMLRDATDEAMPGQRRFVK